MTHFIGAGWGFPVSVNGDGSVRLVDRETEIQQAIRLVLGTVPGERPMRPEFGCRMHDRVFETAGADTASLVALDVREALERWEPRIDLEDVVISFSDDDPTTLFIDVRYSVRGVNDPRNLVFPFYVIPEHDAPAASTSPALPGPRSA